jgi:hypothetical protein
MDDKSSASTPHVALGTAQLILGEPVSSACCCPSPAPASSSSSAPAASSPSSRARSRVADELDGCMRGIAEMVDREYPLMGFEREHTRAELDRLRTLPDTADGLAGRRAMLLLMLFLEDAVALRHAVDDAARADEAERAQQRADPRAAPWPDRPSFVEDMDTRVLPVMQPYLLSTLCQRPDVFVRTCAVLHAMWPGESLRLFDPYADGAHAGELA